jgi:hypothetical protein
MGDRAAVPPKLPVARTIVEGYWWTIWHLRAYAAMALVWAAVAAALQLLLGNFLESPSDSPGDASPIGTAARYAPGLVVFAATSLGAVVVGVAAYRLVILDEPTDWRRALRPGRRELRVFGISFLIYIVAVAEALALTLLFHLIGILDATGESVREDREAVLIIATLLWSLMVALTLTPFVGFAFPLAATDAPSGLFHRSFRMSRGHRLRLACIAFVADLPWVLGSRIPWVVWESSISEMPESLQVGMSTFITLSSTAFGAMVLGKAFVFVANRQHEGTYGVFD